MTDRNAGYAPGLCARCRITGTALSMFIEKVGPGIPELFPVVGETPAHFDDKGRGLL